MSAMSFTKSSVGNEAGNGFSGFKRNRTAFSQEFSSTLMNTSNAKKAVSVNLWKKQVVDSLRTASNEDVKPPVTKMIKREMDDDDSAPRVKIDPDIFESSSEDDSGTDDDGDSNYADSGVSSTAGVSPESLQTHALTVSSKRQPLSSSNTSSHQGNFQSSNKLNKQPVINTSKFGKNFGAFGGESRNFSVMSSQNIRPFCYHCKRYGHYRKECHSQWYHWWPPEYLIEHPWMRRQVREIREIRFKGHGYWNEYMRRAKKLEDDVERADQKKFATQQNKFSREMTPQRYFQQRPNTTIKSRADGQQILRALRRTTPPTTQNNSQHGLPQQFTFSFDCKSIIEQLERQIEELKLTLTEIKSGSKGTGGAEKNL